MHKSRSRFKDHELMRFNNNKRTKMFENQPMANTWSKHPADLYGRHRTVDDCPAEAVLVREVACVVSLVAVIFIVQAEHWLLSVGWQLFLQPGGDLGPMRKAEERSVHWCCCCLQVRFCSINATQHNLAAPDIHHSEFLQFSLCEETPFWVFKVLCVWGILYWVFAVCCLWGSLSLVLAVLCVWRITILFAVLCVWGIAILFAVLSL